MHQIFLPVWVAAGGDEEIVDLVLAVAEALLGHVIHGVHHLPAIIAHTEKDVLKEV